MNVGRVISFCVHSAVFKNITTLKYLNKGQSMYFNIRTVEDTLLFLIVMPCTKKWEHWSQVAYLL